MPTDAPAPRAPGRHAGPGPLPRPCKPAPATLRPAATPGAPAVRARRVALLLGLALLAGPGAARAADADAPPAAAPGPPAGEWLPRGGAELRLLDTQSAQASTLTLAVGQSRQVQSLTITLRACLVRPPDQAADAAAQLDVTDAKGAGAPFHGWMFAAEPQLAMLENPGYGLLLVACR